MREIYHLTDNEEIRLKTRIASRMMKMMMAKITEHDPKWEREHW
jgi:hypothetical protein